MSHHVLSDFLTSKQQEHLVLGAFQASTKQQEAEDGHRTALEVALPRANSHLILPYYWPALRQRANGHLWTRCSPLHAMRHPVSTRRCRRCQER